MYDPRLEYEELDSATPPGADDGGGLPPHDRIQVVGWVGLFLALFPGLVALIYLGPPETWTARDATVAFGLAGVLTGLYLVGGGLLVVRGLQSRPVTGDAVRYFNLLIVMPFLLVPLPTLLAPVLLPLFGWLIAGTVEPMTWLLVAMMAPTSALEIARLVRKRREVVRGVLAWLDPTVPVRSAAGRIE